MTGPDSQLRKVLGAENPADLFAKHLVGADNVKDLLAEFGCDYRDDRANSAPRLRESQGTTKGETLVTGKAVEGRGLGHRLRAPTSTPTQTPERP